MDLEAYVEDYVYFHDGYKDVIELIVIEQSFDELILMSSFFIV